MSKINNVNVKNEEAERSDELTESHFDEEGHNDSMKKIKEKKAIQKKADLEEVGKLTELLLKDEKMPINDFIDNYRKDGLNEEEIAKKLIIQGYSWDEFMDSSIDKQVKSILDNLRKDAVENSYRYIFRFKDKEDLANKYFDILREQLTKNIHILDAVKSIPLKRTITMEDIKLGEEKLHEKSPGMKYDIDLSGEILPDFDWSKSREVFNYLSFDEKTFSRTSKEHLPAGFNPKEVFEKGKSIGLWVDDVHKMGYSGKGVSVAICDCQLKPHKDIQPKEYTVEENASNVTDYMHASAVSSILAGRQTGIVPDSNLYFFAEHQNEKGRGDDLKSAFEEILKKNKELPDNEKIRIISKSGPLYGESKEEFAKLVNKLEKSGVWVLYANEFWNDFGYLEKKDPMGDPNILQTYQHCCGRPSALYVNSGDRTVVDPKSDDAYRHDIEASASRAIPVVAGYYVLACQADPSMTPERFKELARDTSEPLETIIKDGWDVPSASGKDATISVINIKKLIERIEEEKNK